MLNDFFVFFNKKTDPITPHFKNGAETEHLTWTLRSEQNLKCIAYGDPVPTVRITKNGRRRHV